MNSIPMQLDFFAFDSCPARLTRRASSGGMPVEVAGVHVRTHVRDGSVLLGYSDGVRSGNALLHLHCGKAFLSF